MGVAMTLLRSMARQGLAPEEIMRRMNDELREQNPRGMFVTLQCLVFDLAKSCVTCASAGHLAAVRLTPGGSPELAFPSSGLVLGLLPTDGTETETLELRRGETFVLYTDGVSEAFDPNGELFGMDRLLAQLECSPGRSAQETTRSVLDAVRRHAAGAQQSDDITVLSVRYAGSA
jgi:phosphoserine phosphatase RsbU/P